MRVKSFTLIELLIVLVIIGVLATLAVPQYQTFVEKARFSQAVTTLQALKTAEISYKLESGSYSPFNWLSVPEPSPTEAGWVGVYPEGLTPKILGDQYFTYACINPGFSKAEYAVPPGATGDEMHMAASAYRRAQGPAPGPVGIAHTYLFLDLETGILYVKYPGKPMEEYK